MGPVEQGSSSSEGGAHLSKCTSCRLQTARRSSRRLRRPSSCDSGRWSRWTLIQQLRQAMFTILQLTVESTAGHVSMTTQNFAPLFFDSSDIVRANNGRSLLQCPRRISWIRTDMSSRVTSAYQSFATPQPHRGTVSGAWTWFLVPNRIIIRIIQSGPFIQL